MEKCAKKNCVVIHLMHTVPARIRQAVPVSHTFHVSDDDITLFNIFDREKRARILFVSFLKVTLRKSRPHRPIESVIHTGNEVLLRGLRKRTACKEHTRTIIQMGM